MKLSFDKLLMQYPSGMEAHNMNIIKQAKQTLFQQIRELEKTGKSVTDSAFCQQRNKIRPGRKFKRKCEKAVQSTTIIRN